MSSSKGLSLLVYDRTCPGPKALGVRWPGLTTAWKTGDWLFRNMGRFQHSVGIASWEEALQWLSTVQPDQPIAEIQYWGHGLWGRVLADVESLSIDALRPGHKHYDALSRVRDRLIGPEALWWFRTCETFGNERGHEFAHAWTEFFQCRSAGHTYVIGFYQSGLHSLKPGQAIHWSAAEGLPKPDASGAMNSGPLQPNTITCMTSQLPRKY